MAVSTQLVSIDPGQSVSGVINCSQGSPVRLRMPPDWNGGKKGVITFLISTDQVNYMDYFDSAGNEVQAVVTPGATVRVDHVIGGKGTTWAKIRCGSREAPVVQKTKVDFVAVIET